MNDCEFQDGKCIHCGWTVPEKLRNQGPIRRNCPALRAMPSLPRRAMNLAGSVADLAADGFRLVGRIEQQRRLAICETCPENDQNTCRICGCNLRCKVKGRAWHCPIGKW